METKSSWSIFLVLLVLGMTGCAEEAVWDGPTADLDAGHGWVLTASEDCYVGNDNDPPDATRINCATNNGGFLSVIQQSDGAINFALSAGSAH